MVVEKRSFVDKEKYLELKEKFTKDNDTVESFNQVIYKYKSEVDFRLIRDPRRVYLRLRGSSVQEGDIIVNIIPDEVQNLMITLRSLGMYEEVKWYRKRIQLTYQEYDITLDETFEYGYVVSIAKEVEDDEKQEETLKELEQFFETLKIAKITAEQFNDRYKYYKIHWVDLEQKIDEEQFLQP